MYTLLIKNGIIIDGTGNPWFRGDVAIEGDTIKKIGKIPAESAEKIIDAKGLAVSPGFIDPHTHFDLTLTLPNHTDLLEPYIRQGVTTFGIGNCGMSAAPVTDESLDLMKGYLALITAGTPSWSWRSMGDYLNLLDKQGVAFNVAALVGQGAIRFSVMGAKAGKPSREEMEEMKALLRRSLEEGAFGMSTGLVYPPGMWTSTDELVELAKVLAEYGAVYTSHVRGSSETGIDSEKELVTIAKTGVRVQHSHHEAFGEKFWGNVYETVRIDEEARREGLDIAYDVIPYTYVNTYLTAIFPPWALEGGMPKLVERLKDPETRAKIKKDVTELIPIWPPWEPGRWPHNLVEAGGWENIGILSIPSGRKRDWIGKTLVEIGKKLKKDPFDVAADLIVEEGGGVMAFYLGVTGDRGLKFLLSHPLASGNSDAILTGTGVPHAAAYGTYPRIIGYYGRELGLYSLEEAVRKVTSSPARRLGLERRGILEAGMYADITVFDPKRIIDKASMKKPAQYPEGIEYVIINGQLVFEKGKYYKKLRAGKVLRRT
jgi:N-acyl-D-amino-acid deacylase